MWGRIGGGATRSFLNGSAGTPRPTVPRERGLAGMVASRPGEPGWEGRKRRRERGEKGSHTMERCFEAVFHGAEKGRGTARPAVGGLALEAEGSLRGAARRPPRKTLTGGDAGGCRIPGRREARGGDTGAARQDGDRGVAH